MDVSTVRQSVVHFSSGNIDMKDKPHSDKPRRFFMSVACRLLFITGENTLLMVLTVYFVTENLLCQIMLLCSLHLL